MTAVMGERRQVGQVEDALVVYSIHCLDHTGDSEFTWDPRNPDEVNTAREHFERLRGKGFLLYKIGDSDDDREAIRAFDPHAARIVAVPQLQGG